MSINTMILTLTQCTDIARILTIKHGASLRGREFSVSATTEGSLVRVTVTLATRDEKFYYPVQAQATPSDTRDGHDTAQLMLDYIDAYFDTYFGEDEAVYLPIDWGEREFEGLEFCVRGQILNLRAEREADALLAASTAHASIS